MQTSGTRNQITAPGRKRRYVKWLILLAGLGLAVSMMVTSAVIGAYYFVAPGLPPAETIREIPLQTPLRISAAIAA